MASGKASNRPFRPQEQLSCVPLMGARRRAEADLRAVLPGIPATSLFVGPRQGPVTSAGKRISPNCLPALRRWRHRRRRWRVSMVCTPGSAGGTSATADRSAVVARPGGVRLAHDSLRILPTSSCCSVLGSALIRPPTSPSPSSNRTEQVYTTKTGLVRFRFTPLHVYHIGDSEETPQPNGDLGTSPSETSITARRIDLNSQHLKGLTAQPFLPGQPRARPRPVRRDLESGAQPQAAGRGPEPGLL